MSEVTVAALIEHGKKLAEAALPGGWAASFDECCKVKDAVGTVATLSQTYLRGRRRAAEVEGTARFIAHHSPANMLRLYAEIATKDAEIARLREAALLAKEALAHSLPVAKYYPEPVERHDTALKAISAALEAHHE